MKKITGYFIAFSLVLALPLANAWAQTNTFEGSVTWTMTMPQMGDQPHTITSNFKDGKVEQEMDMGSHGLIKTYVVQEKNAKKYYMVMEAAKRGMTVEVPNKLAAKHTTSAMKLIPTGGKATIAGHKAVEYSIKTPTGNLSLWVCSDFPKSLSTCVANSMRDQPRQDESSSNAFRQLARKGLVPVKVVAMSGGKVAMTMQFVKFQPKKLADALFVPPTDIQYMPMPTMGGPGN